VLPCLAFNPHNSMPTGKCRATLRKWAKKRAAPKAAPHPYMEFKTMEEMEAWADKFVKENEVEARKQGRSMIDFNVCPIASILSHRSYIQAPDIQT
jgi:hypothetical protein